MLVAAGTRDRIPRLHFLSDTRGLSVWIDVDLHQRSFAQPHLLLHRLHRHEARVALPGRGGDRLSVVAVVLGGAAMAEGSTLRGDHLRLQPEGKTMTGPMVRPLHATIAITVPAGCWPSLWAKRLPLQFLPP